MLKLLLLAFFGWLFFEPNVKNGRVAKWTACEGSRLRYCTWEQAGPDGWRNGVSIHPPLLSKKQSQSQCFKITCHHWQHQRNDTAYEAQQAHFYSSYFHSQFTRSHVYPVNVTSARFVHVTTQWLFKQPPTHWNSECSQRPSDWRSIKCIKYVEETT